jgi:hypothetical protein
MCPLWVPSHLSSFDLPISLQSNIIKIVTDIAIGDIHTIPVTTATFLNPVAIIVALETQNDAHFQSEQKKLGMFLQRD